MAKLSKKLVKLFEFTLEKNSKILDFFGLK